MTNSDKTFIARMQKNQFDNGVGDVDDFYAKAYTAVKQGRMGHALPPELLADSLKIVDAKNDKNGATAPTRARRAELQARGALGSIALTNIRNPKQLINIQVAFHLFEASRA